MHDPAYGWVAAVVLIALGLLAVRSSRYLRGQQRNYRSYYNDSSWLLGALSKLSLLITAAALWFGLIAAWEVITSSEVPAPAPVVSLIIAVLVLAIPIYLEWQFRIRDSE